MVGIRAQQNDLRTLQSSSCSLPPSSAAANCPSDEMSQIYILCVAGSAEPNVIHLSLPNDQYARTYPQPATLRPDYMTCYAMQLC